MRRMCTTSSMSTTFTCQWYTSNKGADVCVYYCSTYTKYRRLPISTSVMSYTGTCKIQKITVIYDKIQISQTDNIVIFGANFFGTEYLFFQIQICFCTIVISNMVKIFCTMVITSGTKVRQLPKSLLVPFSTGDIDFVPEASAHVCNCKLLQLHN